ncbi:MAG: alpha-L-rhamnosidase N-terminal domain-containing protein, partial [Prevotellaceae bacterium]|nr:alpha-L-rhamnosidase N-terminal domain-containing protein [Prevotellaceae bacterium]
MNLSFFRKGTVAIYLLVGLQSFAFADIAVQNLRCELLNNPLGVDTPNPRLSWEVASDERAVVQTFYQILVASSKDKLDNNEGDVWNSDKVSSDISTLIPCAESLSGRQQCFWKVKVWTNKGESEWSDVATFSVGLLQPDDWSAKWIGLDSAFSWDSYSEFSRLSARYLRKEIKIKDSVKRATAYIVGLGLYELYINGEKIGDQVLAPVPTEYPQDVKYNTFDVTEHLQKGKNVLGTVLGNGR